MTAIPHSNKAQCSTSGLAGAPLGVVSASQYMIAGQSDLFTRVEQLFRKGTGYRTDFIVFNVTIFAFVYASDFLLCWLYHTKVEYCVQYS